MWAIYTDDTGDEYGHVEVLATFDDYAAAEAYRSRSMRCLGFFETYIEEYTPPPHNPLPEDDFPKEIGEPMAWSEEEFTSGIFEDENES